MLPEQLSRLQLVLNAEEYLSDISTGLITGQEPRDLQPCEFQLSNEFDNAIASFDSSLGRLLVALRRERNVSAKVVNLPDEIICEIFSYLGLFGVIKSSQVCYRWRHVALTQPRLWTSVELVKRKTHPDLLSMQIERSGKSPLHLTFGGLSSLLPSGVALQTLLARSRSITQFETRFFDDAGTSSSFLMPLLESMHITAGPVAGMQNLKWMKNCPRLRHLSTGSIVSSEELIYARNLNTLHLFNVSEHPDVILFVLSKLSVLKELRMDNDLILSCSHLNFIGLILRGSQQSWMGCEDDPGLVIESFLESWVEIYGKVFGTLRVQDEADPWRWETHAPLLEMILENFELGQARYHIKLRYMIQFVGQISEYLDGVATHLIRGTLDGVIITLESSGRNILVKLRGERNYLSHAARCSNEIISRIMNYGRPRDVIRWSWVCRRWRQVALNSPGAWSLNSSSEKNDKKILLIQIARSGTHPLDIDFGDRDNLYASLPQSALSSLISHARTITRLTTKIWLNAGILESFRMPYLETLEVNFGMEVSGDSIKCLQNSPRLRHLTLMGASQILFPGLVLGPSLRTLHLSITSGHPAALLFVLSRLPNLKELYLNYMMTASDNGSVGHGSIMPTNTFPNLNFLCLKRCHSSYASTILTPSMIRPGTNVYLEADTIEGPISLDRGGMTSTLWVNAFRNNSFLIGHQTSLTEIILKEKDNIKLVSQLPGFMNCRCVTSIDLNGHLLMGDELYSFPNLVRLVILFKVTPAGVKDRSLATTLNQSLAVSCPQLQFIGLILRRVSPLNVVYVDGTRSIIEDFLDHWHRVYSRPFCTIQIQDELNRWHWGPRSAMLQSFELGNIQPDPRPKFPTTRHTYRTKGKLAEGEIGL
ncbi:hypothetical protein CPB86DRAFT_798561 [Serendipita vermifera]|nr:hypothetical protein CPB86DRAFT_798561 [Serendipita vermifera]